MVDLIQNTNEDVFKKDIEIQSVHSSSTDIEDDENRKEKAQGILSEDDIEAYPVVEETQDEKQRREKGAVTRTSTKSSWKDPGPPPDGGREAWIQGSSSCPSTTFVHLLNVINQLPWVI